MRAQAALTVSRTAPALAGARGSARTHRAQDRVDGADAEAADEQHGQHHPQRRPQPEDQEPRCADQEERPGEGRPAREPVPDRGCGERADHRAGPHGWRRPGPSARRHHRGTGPRRRSAPSTGPGPAGWSCRPSRRSSASSPSRRTKAAPERSRATYDAGSSSGAADRPADRARDARRRRRGRRPGTTRRRRRCGGRAEGDHEAAAPSGPSTLAVRLMPSSSPSTRSAGWPVSLGDRRRHDVLRAVAGTAGQPDEGDDRQQRAEARAGPRRAGSGSASGPSR